MAIRNLIINSTPTLQDRVISTFIGGGRGRTVVTSSADGSKITLGAYDGTVGIESSADFGSTWTPRLAGPVRVESLASSADGAILIAASTFLDMSFDSGSTWTRRNIAEQQWQGVSCSANGQRLIAISASSKILKSFDFGETWTETIPNFIDGNWFNQSPSDICMSEDGTKLIVAFYSGYNTRFARSTDAGSTWKFLQNSVSGAWWCVDCSADGTKIIAGINGGHLYTSIDSGNTWVPRPVFGARNWSGVRLFNADSSFLASSTDGAIFSVHNNIWG